MEIDPMEIIRPLFDRVLVKRSKAPEKATGGLYVPTDTQEQRNRGTVLAVGPGIVRDGELVAPSVKEGDEVLFGKFDGQDLKINGEDGYLILTETEILAVVEQGE